MQRSLLKRIQAISVVTGLSVFVSIPAIAQTAPTPEQPAPEVTPPSETQPPANTTPPSTTQPPGGQVQPPSPTSPSPAQPPASATPPSGNTPTANQPLSVLLQQASSAGSFRTLSQAVEAAGLSNVLQTRGGRYTVFAPTDEAFAALPQGTLEKLLQPENRELLTRILAYHVVPNEVTSNQLRTGAVSTLGGGLAVRVTPERVIVNNGSVVQADIRAANGIIHAVNRVMIPADLRQRLADL